MDDLLVHPSGSEAAVEEGATAVGNYKQRSWHGMLQRPQTRIARGLVALLKRGGGLVLAMVVRTCSHNLVSLWRAWSRGAEFLTSLEVVKSHLQRPKSINLKAL